MIEVPNAHFTPCMDSFLGAWSGVLRALEDERPIEDLWGLSALGLRTQIHRNLLPVGLLPRQWDETCATIVNRTGYACTAGLRDFFYTADDLRQIRLAWMKEIEKALDDGRPAISFGMGGPAFGIITSFDDTTEEYHVSTPFGAAKLEAMELGSINPPSIFVLIPTGPLAKVGVESAELHKTERSALDEAVAHHLGQEVDAHGSPIEVPRDLASGPSAYNAWSAAVENGQIAEHFGLLYSAAYYAEARSAAGVWLKKIAKEERWHKAARRFDKAAGHLAHEAESFTTLAKLFPITQSESLKNPGRRSDASACLRMARAEHIAAMELLIEAMGE